MKPPLQERSAPEAPPLPGLSFGTNPKGGTANISTSDTQLAHFTGRGRCMCSPSSACKPLGFLFCLEAVTLSTDLTEG